jgi:hypothetical protein
VTANDDHYERSGQQTDYVLGELHGYAALRDEETGIGVGEDGRAPTQNLNLEFFPSEIGDYWPRSVGSGACAESPKTPTLPILV